MTAKEKMAAFAFMALVDWPTAWAVDQAGRVVFVSGAASRLQQPIRQDDVVYSGDELSTGGDGYVYIKTVDAGFLILRPGSMARIVAYRVDSAQPSNSQIKIELTQGVARHVSGEAVKQARQNFRFNTPVAAIGVRGTDFTVFTDQDISRVTVASGGVVVNGFSESCPVAGTGPCERGGRELFAQAGRAAGGMLEVVRGQAVPVLLNAPERAPDQLRPPKANEPQVKAASAGEDMGANVAPLKTSLIDQQLRETVVQPSVPVLPNIVWGRWQPVLGQERELDLGRLQGQQYSLVGIAGDYAVMRLESTPWQRPSQNTLAFDLQAAQVSMFNQATNLSTPIGLENASLTVDLAKSQFSTRLDLLDKAERFVLQAQGTVSADGHLHGNSQFAAPTNMALQGVLSADQARQAAYLFRARIDDARVASGVTQWGR